MEIQIIPTIFAHNKKEFYDKLQKIFFLTSTFQIDFMDGLFVSSQSVSLNEIPPLSKFGKQFEAHLMLFSPNKIINKFIKKGFNKLIIHYESFSDEISINEAISQIKKNKVRSFLAINPETPVDILFSFQKKTEGFLIMGVHPGKEHQKIIQSTYEKIKIIRKKFPNFPIQVDGGVNDKTVSKLIKSGANILNIGSYLSSSEDPKKAFIKLENLIKNEG